MNTSKRVRIILGTLDLDPNLNVEEKDKLCTAYQDIYHLEGQKLTHTSVLTHEIPILTDHLPINQKQYRLPYAHRDEVNKQMGKLLDEGIIQTNKSLEFSVAIGAQEKRKGRGKEIAFSDGLSKT